MIVLDRRDAPVDMLPSDAGRFATFGVITALCWLTVLSRFYVKGILIKTLAIDDWLMALSLVPFTIIVGLVMSLLGKDFGQAPDTLLEDSNALVSIHRLFACELLYLADTVIIKLSITFLLLRLAVSRIHRIIVITTAVFYTLCGVALFFLNAFQCSPVRVYWTPSIKGSCLPVPLLVALLETNAAITLVTDLIYALLPIAMIWNIQMDKKTKISVGFVLSLGLSCTAVNGARFKILEDLLKRSNGQIHELYPVSLVTVLELGIGIIAGSLATMRPLLRLAGKTVSQAFAVFSRPTGEETTSSVASNSSRLKMMKSMTAKYLHTKSAVAQEQAVPEPIAEGGMSLTESDKELWLDLCKDVEHRAAQATREGGLVGDAQVESAQDKQSGR
ncbi:MAG: hypothetical protein M1818_006363 [Claussenomyces sp. TS43310]|nr:MAG: hypothetical protein M1818_006363 [Claussenomyces sp. TS43310]